MKKKLFKCLGESQGINGTGNFGETREGIREKKENDRVSVESIVIGLGEALYVCDNFQERSGTEAGGEIVKKHFDEIASRYDYYKKKNHYYYSNLKKLIGAYVPSNQKVLEVGCGTGDILAYLKPDYGLGIDISKNMVEIARYKHPNLNFKVADIKNLRFNDTFDYILLPDVIDHLHDVHGTFKQLRRACNKNMKVIITSINPLWGPLLRLGEKLRLKMPEGPHNWLNVAAVKNLLSLTDFEIIDEGYRLPIPIHIPYISDYINSKFTHIPVLRHLGIIEFVVARPKLSTYSTPNLTCSVIIPCFNEEGNIRSCISRILNMGKTTEIIVVDDGSQDKTPMIVKEIMRENKNVKLLTYPVNKGKGFAVKEGLNFATGDILMILDADMTVPPENLTTFFELIWEGKAEFINGTRLVYPLKEQAMRTLHIFGNRIFSRIFSWLMNKPISDTLCGTKVFLKKDYLRMKMKDNSWPDFDLLFGAAMLNLKLVELPVHYQKRIAGESKMKTFRHGFLLLKMCVRGFIELKLKRGGRNFGLVKNYASGCVSYPYLPSSSPKDEELF